VYASDGESGRWGWGFRAGGVDRGGGGEERRVVRPGDVVVQRGTMDAWRVVEGGEGGAGGAL